MCMSRVADMKARLVLAGIVLHLGCQSAPTGGPFPDVPANQKPLKSFGRVLAPMPPEDFESMLKWKAAVRPDEQDASVVLKAGQEAIHTEDAYMICEVVTRIALWGYLHDQEEQVLPCLTSCMKHPDSLIQWSGIAGAYYLQEHGLARAWLADRCYSLLIQPEVPSAWGIEYPPGLPGYERKQYRSAPALNLSARRRLLIEMVGRYKIDEAAPVLRAILAHGHYEWDSAIVEAAEGSLKALRCPASREGSVLGASGNSKENKTGSAAAP